MIVVDDPREKFSVRWAIAGTVLSGVFAFAASSALASKALNHYLSAVSGVGVVLMVLAPTLREISISLQKWITVVGTIFIGAGLGLLARLVIR